MLVGQPELVPQPYTTILDPAISPDGRTLAFVESSHVVLHDLTTGQTRDITIGKYVDTRLTWSPDPTVAASWCSGSRSALSHGSWSS